MSDITLQAALLTALMEAGDETALRRLGEELGVALDDLRGARGVVAIVLDALDGDAQAVAWVRRAAALARDDEDDTVRPPAQATSPPPERAHGVAPLSVGVLQGHAEELVRAAVELDNRSMRVVEYAVLCAACGAFPTRRREWHARFGVTDDDARRHLDDAWERRFESEPAVRELWDLLLRRFRAWLVQYGAV
jgi:hypothetical protein